jgi:hypothetical protein
MGSARDTFGVPCAAGPDACLDVDTAFAFVRGGLTPEERAEVERRMDLCASCRGVIAEAARGNTSAPTVAAGAVARGGRADSVELAAGDIVGRYQVERPLGVGGMGVVSLARDPELRRAVVIKLVRPDVAEGEGNAAFEARLRREAQAMAQLSHPNVVQIFDIGRHQDRVFLAIEFVPGRTLDAWLIERERSIDEILSMCRQAGAGLAAAHRAGLVHRDFKPTNVLVDDSGIAKVTDFGLARAVVHVAEPHTPAPSTSGVHAMLTRADSVIGTPAYMAPEQLAGEAVDARVDQYSFAVTLLDALLGQSPMSRNVSAADAPEAVEQALVTSRVPPRVRAAIARALRSDPGARFASVDELLRELAPERRARWPFIAAAGALGAVGVVAWLLLRPPVSCDARSAKLWDAATRARVVEAMSAEKRPFAPWTADRIARAIDSAAGGLSVLELGRCGGKAPPADACLEKREAALASAVDKLTAHRAEFPWQLVAAIESCDGPSSEQIGASAVVGSTEDSGTSALAAGDDASAAEEFADLAEVGEQLDDDGVRARALLHQLELAGWQGNAADARRAADALAPMLGRHDTDLRDELVVTSTEAKAFTDVGDAERAWPATEREAQLAVILHDPDAILRGHVARAHALLLLRLDPDAARAELQQALDAVGSASAEARADALAMAADLAIGAHDGPAALAAATQVLALVPARARNPEDLIRAAEARACSGDLAGAKAMMPPIGKDDAVLTVREGIAAARIALEEHAPRDAVRSLGDADAVLGRNRGRKGVVPLLERLELATMKCRIVTADPNALTVCLGSQLLTPLAPAAPVRALFDIVSARADLARRAGTLAKVDLDEALKLLHDSQVTPLVSAEAHVLLSLDLKSPLDDRRTHAALARDIYAQLHRAQDVAALDRWFNDNGGPPPPPKPHDPKDPWDR